MIEETLAMISPPMGTRRACRGLGLAPPAGDKRHTSLAHSDPGPF